VIVLHQFNERPTFDGRQLQQQTADRDERGFVIAAQRWRGQRTIDAALAKEPGGCHRLGYFVHFFLSCWRTQWKT